MLDKLKALLPTDVMTSAKHFLVWVWEWLSWSLAALWRSSWAVGTNPMTYPAMAMVGVLGWWGGHLFGARHQDAMRAEQITATSALETARKQVSHARARISTLEESLTHLQATADKPSGPVAATAARPRPKPVSKPAVEAAPAKPFSWTN